MNLKKWSPLRPAQHDAFREMEELHESLLLPKRADAPGDSKSEAPKPVPAKGAKAAPAPRSAQPGG